MKTFFPTLLAASGMLLLAACDEPAPHFTQEEITTAETLRDKAMQENVAYELVESLTTEIGPRMAGTPEEARAIQWAMEKFAALGFDKVYKEEFKVQLWKRGPAKANITAPFPQPMHVTSLGYSVSTPIGGVETEIVHFKTFDDLVSAPEGAADGKIVFISHKMERHKDGSGYSPANRARSRGAIEAAKKGAVAILIRSIGTDSHRMPHTGMMQYDDAVTKIPAAALSNPDADLLMRQIERGKPVSIAFDMQNEFLGEGISHNVVGEITGSERPDEIVLIGAHIDSWDLGTGAVDDGAGIGITMAAGKIIADMPVRPARTIRVIAFGAEEIGLIGGIAYRQAHMHELDKLIIASESDFGAGPVYSFASNVNEKDIPTMMEIVEVLKPLGIKYGGNEGFGGPDFLPLRAAGMPVASLNQDGSDYFDLHHTADDTLDKIKPDQLTQNVAAYVVFTYLMAQHEGTLVKEPAE